MNELATNLKQNNKSYDDDDEVGDGDVQEDGLYENSDGGEGVFGRKRKRANYLAM